MSGSPLMVLAWMAADGFRLPLADPVLGGDASCSHCHPALDRDLAQVVWSGRDEGARGEAVTDFAGEGGADRRGLAESGAELGELVEGLSVHLPLVER